MNKEMARIMIEKEKEIALDYLEKLTATTNVCIEKATTEEKVEECVETFKMLRGLRVT